MLGRPVDDPFVRATTSEAFRRLRPLSGSTRSRSRSGTPPSVLDALRVGRRSSTCADPGPRGTGSSPVLPHLGNWDAARRAMADRGLRWWRWPSTSGPNGCSGCSSAAASARDDGIGLDRARSASAGRSRRALADGKRDRVARRPRPHRPRRRGRDVRRAAAAPAGPAMLAHVDRRADRGRRHLSRPRPAGARRLRPLAMPEPDRDRRADATAITQVIARRVRAGDLRVAGRTGTCSSPGGPTGTEVSVALACPYAWERRRAACRCRSASSRSGCATAGTR